MSVRNDQCKKVCKILDDALANRPTERDALIVAVQKAFDALTEDGWIPCSKRLPEKNGFYLVTLNNSCTDFCLWEDKKGFGMLGTRWYPCEEVTAWMPLPKPYKSKEEN